MKGIEFTVVKKIIVRLIIPLIIVIVIALWASTFDWSALLGLKIEKPLGAPAVAKEPRLEYMFTRWLNPDPFLHPNPDKDPEMSSTEISSRFSEKPIEYDCTGCTGCTGGTGGSCTSCTCGSTGSNCISCFDCTGSNCASCDSCVVEGESNICRKLKACIREYNLYKEPCVIEDIPMEANSIFSTVDFINAFQDLSKCNQEHVMLEVGPKIEREVCNFAPSGFNIEKPTQEAELFNLTYTNCGDMDAVKNAENKIFYNQLTSSQDGHMRIMLGDLETENAEQKCKFNIYLCYQDAFADAPEDVSIDLLNFFRYYNGENLHAEVDTDRRYIVPGAIKTFIDNFFRVCHELQEAAADLWEGGCTLSDGIQNKAHWIWTAIVNFAKGFCKEIICRVACVVAYLWGGYDSCVTGCQNDLCGQYETMPAIKWRVWDVFGKINDAAYHIQNAKAIEFDADEIEEKTLFYNFYEFDLERDYTEAELAAAVKAGLLDYVYVQFPGWSKYMWDMSAALPSSFTVSRNTGISYNQGCWNADFAEGLKSWNTKNITYYCTDGICNETLRLRFAARLRKTWHKKLRVTGSIVEAAMEWKWTEESRDLTKVEWAPLVAFCDGSGDAYSPPVFVDKIADIAISADDITPGSIIIRNLGNKDAKSVNITVIHTYSATVSFDYNKYFSSVSTPEGYNFLDKTDAQTQLADVPLDTDTSGTYQGFKSMRYDHTIDISAGGSKALPSIVMPVGTNVIGVWVDPYNEIWESSEENNYAYRIFDTKVPLSPVPTYFIASSYGTEKKTASASPSEPPEAGDYSGYTGQECGSTYDSFFYAGGGDKPKCGNTPEGDSCDSVSQTTRCYKPRDESSDVCNVTFQPGTCYYPGGGKKCYISGQVIGQCCPSSKPFYIGGYPTGPPEYSMGKCCPRDIPNYDSVTAECYSYEPWNSWTTYYQWDTVAHTQSITTKYPNSASDVRYNPIAFRNTANRTYGVLFGPFNRTYIASRLLKFGLNSSSTGTCKTHRYIWNKPLTQKFELESYTTPSSTFSYSSTFDLTSLNTEEFYISFIDGLSGDPEGCWITGVSLKETVRNLEISVADLIFSDPSPAIDQDFTTNITVYNTGEVAVSNVNITYIINNTNLNTLSYVYPPLISSIAASSNASIKQTHRFSAGTYRFNVIVDLANSIYESNEWDNSILREIRVS